MLKKPILSSRVAMIIALFMFVNNIASAVAFDLPAVGQQIKLSESYSKPVLKGIRLNPDNPLSFTFIIDSGDQKSLSKEESSRLVRYFLAGLTVPTESLWVNLSPYEKDRIVDDVLGVTDMGRDMLAQDYLLKQLSSTLTHPDTEIGQKYWEHDKQNNDALSKIWIVPQEAVVKEDKGMAIITNSSLRVETAHDVVKDVLAVEIERDVNKGKNFSQLRQIYSALILSTWFKKKFSQSFYKHYMDKNKIAGIDLEDKTIKDKIFNQYVEAFKKGAYDLIKKEYDQTTNRKVKRHYFSGGVSASSIVNIQKTVSESIVPSDFGSANLQELKIDLQTKQSSSALAINEVLAALDREVDPLELQAVAYIVNDEFDVFKGAFESHLESGIVTNHLSLGKMMILEEHLKDLDLNSRTLEKIILLLIDYSFSSDLEKQRLALTVIRKNFKHFNRQAIKGDLLSLVDVSQFDSWKELIELVEEHPSAFDKRLTPAIKKRFAAFKSVRPELFSSSSAIVSLQEGLKIVNNDVIPRMEVRIKQIGQYVRRQHEQFSASKTLKEDRTLITKADPMVQKLMLKELIEVLPFAYFIFEEEAPIDDPLYQKIAELNKDNKDSGWTVFLDPIDGTRSFSSGNSSWTLGNVAVFL